MNGNKKSLPPLSIGTFYWLRSMPTHSAELEELWTSAASAAKCRL